MSEDHSSSIGISCFVRVVQAVDVGSAQASFRNTSSESSKVAAEGACALAEGAGLPVPYRKQCDLCSNLQNKYHFNYVVPNLYRSGATFPETSER